MVSDRDVLGISLQSPVKQLPLQFASEPSAVELLAELSHLNQLLVVNFEIMVRNSQVISWAIELNQQLKRTVDCIALENPIETYVWRFYEAVRTW